MKNRTFSLVVVCGGKMKQLLVLFALLAVGSSSTWKGGLRIRFDIGIDIGGSFFYDIPRNVTEVVSEGWTTQEQPSGLSVTSVTMYCYSDLVVCTFYDADGDVAGLQIALPQDNFTPYYDMETLGFTVWSVNDTSYWTLQQFFTTEEILSARRLRNENQITENGGVWVVGVNKEVLDIANTTSTIEEDGVFTKQACIPWMGRHYYYNMTTSLSCTDEPLFPWFAIVESSELVATGFMVPGNLTLDSSARNWFESPDRSAVEMIVPDGPDCLYEIVENYGMVTMHVYYIDQPWLISCIFQ